MKAKWEWLDDYDVDWPLHDMMTSYLQGKRYNERRKAQEILQDRQKEDEDFHEGDLEEEDQDFDPQAALAEYKDLSDDEDDLEEDEEEDRTDTEAVSMMIYCSLSG